MADESKSNENPINDMAMVDLNSEKKAGKEETDKCLDEIDAENADGKMKDNSNEENEDGPPGQPDSAFSKFVEKAQTSVHQCWVKWKGPTYKVVLIILILGYLAYLSYATYYSPRGAVFLITVTVLYVTHFVYTKYLQVPCRRKQAAVKQKLKVVRRWKHMGFVKLGIVLAVLCGIIVFLAVDVGADRGRLTSATGAFVFLFLAFITSKNPAKVRWRPVVWGLCLQLLLAVVILRWHYGFLAFKWMGEMVEDFLEFTDEGSKFVFGEKGYLIHPLVFKVFPIVIFFSAVIGIMYYWGLMQVIICNIAWLMQISMGTTAIESLNAAANIFIGMAESVVIVAPYLNKLTKSELHAIMTGGFATVAGSYMAVLIQVGASPEHLLSAAIMSAPAALVLAKLNYPETEVSQTRTEEDVDIPKCQERNVVEAAARGAIQSIAVIASILVNLIAFIALMAFLDAVLSYLGGRVGFPELSFHLVCAYILWPLAAIMGVEPRDAHEVGKLLGLKIFVDEFISFRDLGELVKNNHIAERSAIIATYACCGFGSIASVGIYVGALAAVAPERRGDISEIAFRAAINGNVAGFLTACIAGVLFKDDGRFSAFASLRNATQANYTVDYPV